MNATIDLWNPRSGKLRDYEDGELWLEGYVPFDEKTRSQLVDLGWDVDHKSASLHCDSNEDADKALDELPSELAPMIAYCLYSCQSYCETTYSVDIEKVQAATPS